MSRSQGRQMGLLDMKRLGELLIAASSIQDPAEGSGMLISAPGALTIAARALNDMAAPLDPAASGELLRDDFEQRLQEVQPRMAGYTLETFAKHLALLRSAVEAGDSATVGKFFRLYAFE
ncbi:hypothetical protein QRD43_21280 [Pelomonas sp. APW6]|uniref:Uncharacterized protein n=1 Tax=Roseateles subflavus TaxID=3053353 RepID=A0ABT7LQP5_9BURK|nr:hypothetical protein [Pelomonas sp. APW6]MDL5034450.1 hypothetical protein [Pelomonas sp. APW6]